MTQAAQDTLRKALSVFFDMDDEICRAIPTELKPLRAACQEYARDALVSAMTGKTDPAELAEMREKAQQGFDDTGYSPAGRDLLTRIELAAETVSIRPAP